MSKVSKISPLEAAWRRSDNIFNPFLSPDKDEEIVSGYRADFPKYASQFLCIVDDDGRVSRLDFTRKKCQLVLHGVVWKLYKKLGYVRVMVPKARQTGVSTYVQALVNWKMRLWKNSSCRAISNTGENAFKMLEMARMYHSMLPEEIRPPLLQRNLKRMDWGNRDEKTRYEHPGLRSSLEISTAGNPHIGRGSHHQFIHATEVGSWPRSEEVLRAIEPALHDYEPDTFGFLESTSEGDEGGFYDRVMRARDQLSMGSSPEWHVVFLPAWLEERYYDSVTVEEAVKIVQQADPYELGLLKKFKYLSIPMHEVVPGTPPPALTDTKNPPRGAGYLSWRRKKLASVGGNKSVLDKEYADTLEAFFAATGQTLFDKASLMHYRGNTIMKGIVGRLVVPEKGSNLQNRPYFVEDSSGPLTIWEPPQPGLRYGIGADGAIGKKPDPDFADDTASENIKEEMGDFCAAEVLSCFNHQVAEYNSNAIDAKSFGDELFNLGLWYNSCVIMPETGNQSAGYAILDRLMELKYPHIGRWEKPDSINHHLKMAAYGWEVMDKAQPLDSKVLTPNGWKALRYVGHGATIRGLHNWVTVREVIEHGIRQVYKVTFSDGTVCRVSAGHLWEVHTSVGSCVTPTSSLLETGLRDRHGWVWRIPSIEKPIPYPVPEINTESTSFVYNIGKERAISEEPIPSKYKYSPERARIAILRGIMDTIGSIAPRGYACWALTVSRELAEDVQEIVQSLGGVSKIKKFNTYTRVSVNLPESICPFGSSYYKKAWIDAWAKHNSKPEKKRLRRFERFIVSIEEDGLEECRCLKVSSEDGLYLTDGYIVTHNTKQTLIGDLQREVMRGADRLYTRTTVDESKIPKLKIRSMELLRQLQTFAHLSGGAIGAKGGSNDDLVIAFGLSYIAVRQGGGLVSPDALVEQSIVEYTDEQMSDEEIPGFWEI